MTVWKKMQNYYGKATAKYKQKGELAMSKGIDYTALTLVIIGAVNWGLIGIFKLDLVNLLFGNMTWISRIVYTLVGLSGLYLLSLYGRVREMGSEE